MKKDYIAHIREFDKIEQKLKTHLAETADLVEKYASKIGLEECGKLIGLLHDVGKATDTFDNYIRSANGQILCDDNNFIDADDMKGKIDHSTAGAQYLFGKIDKSLAQMLSLIIVSHHSGLIDCITPDGYDKFTRRIQKSQDSTRLNESLANLDLEIKMEVEKLIDSPTLFQSYKSFVLKMFEKGIDDSKTLNFKISLLTRYLFSCLIDADRLNTIDFECKFKSKLRNYGEYDSWEKLLALFNKYIKKFQENNVIDSIRNRVSTECLEASSKNKGLFQLEVPTGGGKTLASLRFALNHAKKNKMDRIIYIIPYTSIIDQNAQIAREIFEKKLESGSYTNNIVLEHHSNLSPEEENIRQKLLAENWDAPVVFTTMVQFFETIFGHGTRSARRMHQLANAVIIFDEVQTVPVNFVHMFNVTLRFLVKSCGSTIVLCTATQPLLDKIEFQRAIQINPEKKIIKNVDQLYQTLKRVEIINKIKPIGYSDVEVAKLAFDELKAAGSVLIIVNTKASSMNLFKEIEKLKLQCNKKELEIYHLNTHMCPAHRMSVISEIQGKLKKNCSEILKPVICVSTQMIEAGVDIDFNAVIRYVAGLDSITQAAGRCNRNGKMPKLGRVLIINPENENLDRLKDIKIGKEITLRVIDEYNNKPDDFDNDIIGLKAINRYYQYYFYDRAKVMNYPVSKNSCISRTDNLFDLLSLNEQSVFEYKILNKDQPPDLVLRQSFETASKIFKAIDSQTIGIIVPYGEKGDEIIKSLCSVNDMETQYKMLKEAQRYSVNVFPYVFQKLSEAKAINESQKDSGIFYLSKENYDKQFGLSMNSVNEMELLYN